MPDIVVKGMKMPRSCADIKAGTCPIYERCPARLMAYREGCNSPAKMNAYYDAIFLGRQEGCPLVELPIHGRLVDADLLEEHYDDLEADNGLYTEEAGQISQTIHNAPTVLEASK